MKDHETLTTHNIKDGLTVHLVIKASTRTTEVNNAPRPPGLIRFVDFTALQFFLSNVIKLNYFMDVISADISATPFGLGALGGLGGLDALGMGSANFMELQQRMQRELLSNPDALRQVMDNPMVRNLMNDPDTMRHLITSNRQMQELMEVR